MWIRHFTLTGEMNKQGFVLMPDGGSVSRIACGCNLVEKVLTLKRNKLWNVKHKHCVWHRQDKKLNALFFRQYCLYATREWEERTLALSVCCFSIRDFKLLFIVFLSCAISGQSCSSCSTDCFSCSACFQICHEPRILRLTYSLNGGLARYLPATEDFQQ